MLNGTVLLNDDFYLYIGGKKVVHAQTFSPAGFEKPVIEITNRDSGGWANAIPGRVKSFGPIEFTAGQIKPGADPSTMISYKAMVDSFVASDASIAWKIGTDVSGNFYHQGVGYLTALKPEFGENGAEATYSGTIHVIGEVSTGIQPN